MTAPKWTKDRIEEFEALHALLIDARGLNHGSHIIERLTRMSETAERLLHTDYGPPRSSFLMFLQESIIKEREPK